MTSPWELRLGDCLDPVTGMASLGDKSVDAMLTDPPYGVSLGADNDKRIGHGLAKDGYGEYRDTAEDFEAVVVPAVTLGVAKSQRSAVFCAGHMAWSLPRPDAIGGVFIPAAQGRCKWGFVSLSHCLFYGQAPDLHLGSHPTAIRSSEIPEPNGHPCPKPVGWMLWLIRLCSRPGDLILDPFAGSGTTGVAAIRLGRRFIGWECDPKYHAIAVKRLTAAREQLELCA